MARYYVNKNSQSNGDHEVHVLGCIWLRKVKNKIYLGDFVTCRSAVTKAKEYYDQVNGCYHCSYNCHTG